MGEIILRRRGDAYEVEGLRIGVHGWVHRVGFEAPAQVISSLLHTELLRLATRIVRWEQIARIEGRRIYLNVGLEQLESVESQPAPAGASR